MNFGKMQWRVPGFAKRDKPDQVSMKVNTSTIDESLHTNINTNSSSKTIIHHTKLPNSSLPTSNQQLGGDDIIGKQHDDNHHVEKGVECTESPEISGPRPPVSNGILINSTSHHSNRPLRHHSLPADSPRMTVTFAVDDSDDDTDGKDEDDDQNDDIYDSNHSQRHHSVEDMATPPPTPEQCSPSMMNNNILLPAKNSWLLRLLESSLCDMTIAIQYLFKYRNTSGVGSYLGNKLFVSIIYKYPQNIFCQ